MAELHFRVIVPSNRNLPGIMRVERDGKPIKEIKVLARGSRGPGDTQFLNNGNTPTGTYDGSIFKSNTGLPKSSYGPWGRIALKPLSGNALEAEKIGGRTGLYIHGGDFATTGPWKNGLKPTHGCIRVSNEDMIFLRDVLFDDPALKMTRTTPHTVKVTVSE